MFFKPRPISKLTVQPPAPQVSRSGIAIVAIVKNEGRFIAEWARFHALAGVRHFYIYDNGSTDDTCTRLQSALPEDATTIIPWNQRLKSGRGGAELHNQVFAFAHALANFGGKYRWMAFVDVDEFIVPMQHNSLDTALSDLAAATHISLPWHMFGRSGHADMPDGGIVKNFLKRKKTVQAGGHALNWKCIVDPCHVTGVRVHGMEVDGKAEGVNDMGQFSTHKARAQQSFISNERLQLNHYYTRANADLQAKLNACLIASVPLTKHAKRVQRIVQEIEADEVEDHAAVAFLKRVT
ncbi:MAG: glycosyltransferase family 92 protein [Yoonia sp.]|nr:glycosyltransferase family 92 protein [Yoonia sp.]